VNHRTHPVFSSGILSLILLFTLGSVLAGCAGYVPAASNPTTSQGGLTISPSSVNFSNVVVGQTLTKTIHIANTGKEPLQLASLKLSSKDFVISGPSVPRSVLPGTGLDYTLAFTPTTAGNQSASISIANSVTTAPAVVTLAGIGLKATAAVQLNPTSVNFGSLLLQTTSTKSVTLQNSGDVNVKISGVTVAGAGFGYADLSPGFSLSPNQTVTFQVWFKPTLKGVAAGTVSVISANLSSPATLSLAGTGVTSSNPNPPPPNPTAHSVHLSWAPSSSSVTGYHVYRGQVSGGPYSSASSSVDALSFDDNSVADGTTYYYVVTSVDSSGVESAYSNQATAQVPNN
jgi:Abnormal spindle-like microcephaly-assoc'd, ASPM-SPD-2-Hydin